MKTNLLLFCGLLLGTLFISQTACTTDKLDQPQPDDICETLDATYNGAVKDIIDRTCAITGCHVNGGGAPGNYETYAGMQNEFTDQGLRRYVVVLRDDPDQGMPPNWDTNPGPKDLTDDEFEIMKCWIDSGYPEN